MMKNKAFQTLTLIPLLVSATLFCGLAQAQIPVTVKSWVVDMGENIEYHYTVTNLTKTRSINAVSIGNPGDQGDDPTTSGNEQPELSVYPTGSYWGPTGTVGDDRGMEHRRSGTFTSPPGWRGSILGYERTDRFSVDWGRVRGSSFRGISYSILPGKSLNYSVTVPKVNEFFPLGDPAYLNGHFTVGFDAEMSTKEGPAFWHYTGLMEALAAPQSP